MEKPLANSPSLAEPHCKASTWIEISSSTVQQNSTITTRTDDPTLIPTTPTMSNPRATSNENYSRIPAEVRALMDQRPVYWDRINQHTHVCADCQPNCAAVYRTRMGKEFRRLNKVFKKYALTLVRDRGWTLTAATETAKMRQAAAARATVEQRRLSLERRAERHARRTLTRIRQGRERIQNPENGVEEESESERERAHQDEEESDTDGDNEDEYEGEIRAPVSMGGGVMIPHRYYP